MRIGDPMGRESTRGSYAVIGVVAEPQEKQKEEDVTSSRYGKVLELLTSSSFDVVVFLRLELLAFGYDLKLMPFLVSVLETSSITSWLFDSIHRTPAGTPGRA
jgi:hypothetical protein